MSPTSLILAFWLGIAFAAPPGIVTVECIRRGLKGGYWSAFAVGLGSLIGDAAYAILAFSGLGFVVRNNVLKFIIGLFGAAFMIYLAISAFKNKTIKETEMGIRDDKNRGAFMSGTVLSLTNPFAIAFWLGFGGILISSGTSTDSENLWLFLIVFLAGSAFWGVFILSWLVAFGKKFINDKVFHVISFISGLVFLGTATYAVWKLIQ